MTLLYEKERQDKEHTAIAYKRFINNMELEKQSNSMMGSLNSSNGRISPSPKRNSTQLDSTHMLIKQLQEELDRKDSEIQFYRNQSSQYPVQLMVPSEENMLDEIDDDESNKHHVLGTGH